ncbi:nuclear transport factor 2 family protein [Kitasatospora sp. NBC_01266]|uniref:nuclear transport factor 2 family protein n=1 Tax=Kitasatospora sp. NBC_01266 TaxID=2903572 RepID=UPI002E36441E|nr:nuclear transport factor 2 family protein [Kitasatospora sp. NBC_01266]
MNACQDPRIDVVEATVRMCDHTDRREWKELAGVFTEQVTVDYTSLVGGEPATVPRDGLIESWRQLLETLDATQHLISNHVVALDGDQAHCTAQFQAVHVHQLAPGGSTFTLGGRYRFALAREREEWRITSVVMTAVWSDGNRALLGGGV